VRDKLRQFGIFSTFGEESFFPTVEAAVRAFALGRGAAPAARVGESGTEAS
jgi:hypothetical protein